ncbi:hypothetical protein ACGVWS_02630 [Enterobacteriaceae bacterium LUAb1]
MTGRISKSRHPYLDHTLLNMIQLQSMHGRLKFDKKALIRTGKGDHLHKQSTAQAGLAVLKTPDIRSILVETADIRHLKEEKRREEKRRE